MNGACPEFKFSFKLTTKRGGGTSSENCPLQMPERHPSTTQLSSVDTTVGKWERLLPLCYIYRCSLAVGWSDHQFQPPAVRETAVATI